MAAHNWFARLSIAAALLIASAISLYAYTGSALAQPQLTESDPSDGASIAELPSFLLVCFSEAIDFENLPEGFSFTIIPPDGPALGLRTEWQTDSQCAHVFPGRPAGGVKGEWTFRWTVLSVATGESGTGSFTFNVTQEASPAPTSPPAPFPRTSPTAAPTSGGGDGGGPDILELALLTIAAAAGAAVIGLVGYLIRRRIGYFPHRPPPRDGSEQEHH